MSDTKISYSQFSLWKSCKHRWELAYAKRLRSKVPTVHTVFGTAMHNTLQSYMVEIFKNGEPPLDIVVSLFENMHVVFTEELNKHKQLFSSPEELTEIYNDGVNIVKFIHDRWLTYYNFNDIESVDIELPIDIVPNANKPSLKFVAYLDVVKKYKNHRVVIQDYKTSKDGWNRFQINDESKIAQLILYRYFYSILYNTPIENIDVEFFILKRKPSTPSLVTILPIPNDALYTEMIVKEFNEFIDQGFNEDGSCNTMKVFDATSGKNDNNCMFCEFKDQHDLCPPLKRIKSYG